VKENLAIYVIMLILRSGGIISALPSAVPFVVHPFTKRKRLGMIGFDPFLRTSR
jgi:hypothetical protein